MKPFVTLKVFPHCLRLPRFLKIRQRYAGKDLCTRENLMESICNDLAVKEKKSSDDVKQWIMNSFYPGFVAVMKYQRNGRSGIDQVLYALKKSGIQLGVLSDYDFVVPRLQSLKIDTNYFSVITSSEVAGALKPSIRPFLQIAKLWSINPENILVIGDQYDTDGQGAKTSGMQFCRILDKGNDTNGLSWEQMKDFLVNLSR